MQANLVFSPFTVPSVPLGIAHMKSYVEKNSAFKVKCFDLNATYVSMLCDNVNTLCNKPKSDAGNGQPQPENMEEVRKAIEVLSDFNKGFFDQVLYNDSAKIFAGYFGNVSNTFLANCGESIVGEQTPPRLIFEYANLLRANSPDLVGFSVMFPQQLSFAVLLARALKASNRNIKIVFGGATGSTLASQLDRVHFVDFVVTNEGEEALLALLNALHDGAGLDDVPNLSYRRKNGCTDRNQVKSMLIKLDGIPIPDFSDLDLKSGYLSPATVIPVLGSRGCYWRKCTFCVHHKTYSERYRIASIKRVVDEIEQHVDNGFRHFSFVDEMIPPKRFRQLNEEIQKRNLAITYYAMAQPTDRFSREILDGMYEAGCRYILWGVESGSQRVLDLIDKGTTVETVSRVLTDAAAAGIKNHTFIIIGFPTETKEELRETLNFLYEHRNSIHAVLKSSFGLHEGSGVFKNPEKFGITKVYESRVLFGDAPFNYDVSSGISLRDSYKYKDYLEKKFFRHFLYFLQRTAFRDHGLLLYSNPDKLVFNMERTPIPSPADFDFHRGAYGDRGAKEGGIGIEMGNKRSQLI